MARTLRVAFAAACALAFVLSGGSAQSACISGGSVSNIADCVGVAKGGNDCLIGFAVDFDGADNPPLDSKGDPTTKIVCTDGDTCDRDGAANGVCTFEIGACVNASGGSCGGPANLTAPLDLGKPSQKDIDKKSIKSPQAFFQRRTLLDNVGGLLPTAGEACTADDLKFLVPLSKSKGTCDSPAGAKCSNDQDCDTFCNVSLKKAGAAIKIAVNDGGSNKDSDSLKFTCLPSEATSGCPASAFQVTNPADLIGGPVAQGRVNDWMLNNGSVRTVIRGTDLGRQFSFMVTYPGHIIDADLVRDNPADDRDNWIGMHSLINIASTQNTTNIMVLNDGTNCGAGIIRTTGPDDLFDVLSPDLAIYAAGGTLSVGVDPLVLDENHVGVNLPIDLQTDYVLRPDTNYVLVATTVTNNGTEDLQLHVGDYLNPAGHLEIFGPGLGFGEPQLRLGGDGGTVGPQGLDFIAGQGVGSSRGVTYGVVFPETLLFGNPTGQTYFTSAFGQSGIFAWAHNQNLIGLLNSQGGKPKGPLLVPANGGSNTLRRWFVVGDTVADVTTAREELFGTKVGMIQGTVTSDPSDAPVADAHVAFIRKDVPGNRCKLGENCQNVFSATLTDDGGFYRAFLPPGEYSVEVRGGGFPYQGGGGTPAPNLVTLKAKKTATVDVALPETGGLRVIVQDQGASAIAAKVSVVGFEKSPDPQNVDTVLNGFIDNVGRYFGYDPAEHDEDIFGVAKVLFADTSGDTGIVDIEPGTYNILVSHGPEYSVYNQRVTIAAGATTTVNATVSHVVDSTGFVSIDTHVHSIPSPDSNVTRTDRVISMLAEGVDFFVPSDHDRVVDFSADIAAVGASSLIGSAPSDEITSFNFGHFNVWPLTVDGGSITGGALDWGRSGEPDGFGYVGDSSYDLSPAEIFGSFNPATQVIQINHFNSGTLGHFNNLGIDTEAIPPVSSNEAYRCDGAVPSSPRAGLPCEVRICLGGTNDGLACTADSPDCDPGGTCHVVGLGRDCPGTGNCVSTGNLAGQIRQDPALTNLFDDSFTALEVWIEAIPAQTDLALNDNLADWAGLLNQGIFKTGIADSDTHQRTPIQSGSPRTYVASSTDDPGSVSANDLAVNVNAGRAIGTYGLFMTVELEGDLAATASHALADPLTVDAAGGGSDMVNIHIESPVWVEFDTIEIYMNAQPDCIAEWTFHAVVNRACDVTPDVVLTEGVDFTLGPPIIGVSGSGLRYSEDISEPLTITEDTWVIVVARGTQGNSAPLFPVLPQGLQTAGNSGLNFLTDFNTAPPWNDGEVGQYAMAFSNPLYFDFEGDGFCNNGTACPP